MKLYVVCVRDVRADQYGNPYCVAAIGQAERGFADECNRQAQDNVMYMHPEDFELYLLGSFETDVGRYDLLIAPTQLAVGSAVARQSPAQLKSV